MVNKKLFLATFIGLVILSIIGSTGAFAQTQMATTTANATAAAATASATTSEGFLGLPGFEAVYAVAGLLIVAYLVMQRRR
jgi:PGF-CTERM protein